MRKSKIKPMTPCRSGEAICSVYIQPEGFGPPQQQMGTYKKEYQQSFQSTEQKSQTGSQTFQQRSYQQTVDKRSYMNGSSTSIEDFKVGLSSGLVVENLPRGGYVRERRRARRTERVNPINFPGRHVRVQTAAGDRISRVDYPPLRGRIGRADFDDGGS